MKPTTTTRANRIVAILALAALALLSLAACASPEPQIIEREIIIREVEVVKEVEVEVQVVVTATPATQPTAAPTPVHTSTPVPSPTPKPTRANVEKPIDISTIITPTAIPTPAINDYYVIINQGWNADDGHGLVSLYDEPNYIESGDGSEFDFNHEDFFINYLLSQGLITPEQRNAYYTPISAERLHHHAYDRAKFSDEDFVGNTKIPLRDFANAAARLHALSKNERSSFYQDEHIETLALSLKPVLKYADKDLLNPDNYNIPSEESGYVVIRDGSIAVSGTSEDGVTTSVSIDTVDTGELLDYLLSRNKITVAQRDEYGRTGELELSLGDMPGFFDWAISSDEGVEVGINEEGIEYIRENVLPLFGGE